MDKYKKFTARVENLIKEFDEKIMIKRKSYRSVYGETIYFYSKEDYGQISEWLMKVENILVIIFSEDSPQVKRFDVFREKLIKGDLKAKEAYPIIESIRGLVKACLDDIKEGFLQGQEFIIANEVFDSVLEEARFFLKEQKNKDISAILLRIVLGDALKRISEREGIEILDSNGKGKKFSTLNDELKAKEIYNQTTWRQILSWLDAGNEAAHGNFDKYNFQDVEMFYEGINNFMSNHFQK